MKTIIILLTILFVINKTNAQIIENKYNRHHLQYNNNIACNKEQSKQNKILIAIMVNSLYFIATDYCVFIKQNKSLLKPACYGFIGLNVVTIGYIYTFNNPKKYKH